MCLFQHPAAEIAHMQFLLSSISTLIGLENYQKMILDNNKYFMMLATVPISGITSDILYLEIHIDNEKDPNKHLSLCAIIKLLPWYIHIEHTQTANKILVLTTKSQLTNAWQWLC